MAVEQMNISISPQMAKFIRSKVKAGGYTNISEVVRTAVRRMQEEEAREARLACAAADGILAGLTDNDRSEIRDRTRAGFAAIERGEYTEYAGREGLAEFAAGIKSRGRKRLAGRARQA
jgi:antitoxin ParD1/3/4